MDPFTLAGLFIGSLLLPPFGIFWGLKYIREDNQQSKLVGLIACGLTILSIIFAVVGTMKIYTIVSNGVSNKLQEYQGL
jgi:formate hydrogenlyase subunit 3/multisubunit Na+/H+ antiporter MnhD subunit